MRSKTKLWIGAGLGLCLFLIGGMAGAQQSKSGAGTKLYKGAWFDVRYPADFTAQPSLKEGGTGPKYISAFFTSPDKSVRFYIFSPLWNGDPKDVALNPRTEERIYRKQEKTTEKGGTTRTVTWTTDKAKDGSYLRSLQDTETSLNTRKVLGIIYHNQTAYDRYKSQYLRFKQSLRQYAD